MTKFPTITAADVTRIREKSGRDQGGFGKALGVSERTVRGWEAGGTIPASAQLLLHAANAALLGGAALSNWAGHFAAQLRREGQQ